MRAISCNAHAKYCDIIAAAASAPRRKKLSVWTAGYASGGGFCRKNAMALAEGRM
jgi:hypothetical protein